MSTATDQLWGGLPGLINGGAGIVGADQAAGDRVQGNQNAIDTQQGVQTRLDSIYQPAKATGDQAFQTLGSLFGANGQAPDYSSFKDQPGYAFTLDQGTKAINRQASATGNLYTPQTLQQVGTYAEGVASGQYNNYVNQLLQAAGLGGNANAGLANGTIGVGNNISQAQINQGNANASGAVAKAGAIGSTFGNSNLLNGALGLVKGLGGTPGSTNASGVVGAAGNLLSRFGGGQNGDPYSIGTPNYTSNDTTGYDPVTGEYNTPSSDPDSIGTPDYNPNQGYDPFTGDYSTPSNDPYSIGMSYDPKLGDDSTF